MARHPATTSPRDTLNLRIKSTTRELIDEAARVTGKTRTGFVLDAAQRAAEDALLDRTVITVGPEAHAAFLARLDEAPAPNERLRRTLLALPPG